MVAEGFGEGAHAFAAQQQLLDYLSKAPITTGTVLVKGSRSARMEKVVDFLIDINESQPQPNLAEGKR
jgi:UDP-N-acetylmuramyl pentapeptide synthase